MFAESTVRVATDPDVDLFLAETFGPDDRTLLVIHGGPDWDHSYLRKPLDRLGGDRRVLLPDLRGCGRSTRGLATHDYTWDAVVADLLALLDALGIEQADVLGFSTGGAIAQRLTLAAPHRVRSLIIASSSTLPIPEGAYGAPMLVEREARLARGAALGPDPEGVSGADFNRAQAFRSAPADVWRAEALDEYLARLAEVRFSGDWLPGWQAGTLGPSRPADSAARLAELSVPILLLHGRHDLLFPAALAESAAELLPTAQDVILDDAAHMAHLDQPEAWLAAVQTFLTRR